MIKAYLNISFDKLVQLAPRIVGIKPSKATIYRAWLRLARWAEKTLKSPPLETIVIDSTGIRDWGRSFKLHIAYSLDRDMIVAIRVTDKDVSDAVGLKMLLKGLRGPGILLADAAYFGLNLFEMSMERNLLLIAKPRKPPKGGRRRSKAKRLEKIYDVFRELYRHRGEGERGCLYVKYMSRWRVFYRKVESCYAHMLYLALVRKVVG